MRGQAFLFGHGARTLQTVDGGKRDLLLLGILAGLIKTSAAHAVDHQRESAPVWIPRNGKDSHGVPYVVLTCTECLRSFPLSVLTEDLQKIQETPCIFCPNTVRYIIDFSLEIASPRPDVEAAALLQGVEKVLKATSTQR